MQLPKAAIWQLYALATAVAALVLSLLFRGPWSPVFAIAIAAVMGWYVSIIAQMVRTRRMPLDFTASHAIAGAISLMLAIVVGIALTFIGGDSSAGARLAPVYGVLGLLGFFSNFIIGMSYQLFAGFVARARTGAGWPAVTISEISIFRPRIFILIAFNLAIAILVAGFLGGSVGVARIGASIAAAGGHVYCAITIWTLSFAFRQALPASARRASLRVLP